MKLLQFVLQVTLLNLSFFDFSLKSNELNMAVLVVFLHGFDFGLGFLKEENKLASVYYLGF